MASTFALINAGPRPEGSILTILDLGDIEAGAFDVSRPLLEHPAAGGHCQRSAFEIFGALISKKLPKR